jgi:PleD family two-component response regulator
VSHLQIPLASATFFDILRKSNFPEASFRQFSPLAGHPLTKILILTTDQELALLRQRVLATAGHQVIALTTEKEAVEAAEKQVPCDAALMCWDTNRYRARCCLIW